MFHYITKFKWHNIVLFVLILFWAAMDILCWLIYSFLQATKDTFKERIIQNQINTIREDILDDLTHKPYNQVKANSKGHL